MIRTLWECFCSHYHVGGSCCGCCSFQRILPACLPASQPAGLCFLIHARFAFNIYFALFHTLHTETHSHSLRHQRIIGQEEDSLVWRSAGVLLPLIIDEPHAPLMRMTEFGLRLGYCFRYALRAARTVHQCKLQIANGTTEPRYRRVISAH